MKKPALSLEESSEREALGRFLLQCLENFAKQPIMSQKWLEMQFAVPDEVSDLVSHQLMNIGCTGITAADVKLDSFTMPDPDTLKNAPVLKAYFEYPKNVDDLILAVQGVFKELSTMSPNLEATKISYREIAEQDWASQWQQNFPPIKVGNRLVISPSWIDWQVSGSEVVLTLDPGQAFGTGTHATTKLCLEAIGDHFNTHEPPRRILDVGTGSGILAMAGAALGATDVVATDIDSEACRVAQANITKNHLNKSVQVTDTLLNQISGTYDLVLANILAKEVLRLADDLIAHLSCKSGRLVLSGILVEHQDQILDGFSQYPLTLLTIKQRDGWACFVYECHE